jgi:hypothetical protein
MYSSGADLMNVGKTQLIVEVLVSPIQSAKLMATSKERAKVGLP